MRRVKLDTVANLSIILFCAVVGAVLIRRSFFAPQRITPPSGLLAGETSEPLRRALPTGTEQALFIALSPRCGYCTESTPFYRRLLAERVRRGVELPIVAVVAHSQDREAEQELMSAAGIRFDHWATVDFEAARVPGTPTLVLLDQSGRAAEVWVGKLDPETEEAVLARLLGSA